MVLSLFLLAVGLALIVKGGDLFVAASVRIAEILRMPRVVIGGTLVSLATTSPELVVSIVSGLQGSPGLAVGNAVGSCICNIGLILGLSAALRHVEVHPRQLRWALGAMFGGGALLFGMTADLVLSRLQGGVLIILGLAYLIWDFRQHWLDRKPADVREATAIEAEQVRGHRWLETPTGTAVLFAFGALLVVAGSKLLVDSAVAIATALGIPSIVIGLSVVAVGTSLPELVTAITSARKNVSDLAVGNVLGANVANLTLIVGTAAAIEEVTMSRVTQLFNFPALLLGMVLLVVTMFSGRRITRTEGGILLAYYAGYLAVLVLLAGIYRMG